MFDPEQRGRGVYCSKVDIISLNSGKVLMNSAKLLNVLYSYSTGSCDSKLQIQQLVCEQKNHIMFAYSVHPRFKNT